MKIRKSITTPLPEYGHFWKNEKFYEFSRREGVLVVKGWPTLKAWCKPPNRKYFSPCRPEIYLGERPSVSRSWRVTTPPTVDDQWEKENRQLMDGKEPADHIELFSNRSKIEDMAEVLEDAEMSLEESAYYAIKMRNRAESLRALKSFAETFPVEVWI